MTDDRELLELAMKAAGIKGEWMQDEDGGRPYFHNWENGCVFDPLTYAGDALRLAVKLKIGIHWMNGRVCAYQDPAIDDQLESCREDALANTRHAIVRVAAEIGKAMP